MTGRPQYSDSAFAARIKRGIDRINRRKQDLALAKLIQQADETAVWPPEIQARRRELGEKRWTLGPSGLSSSDGNASHGDPAAVLAASRTPCER